MPCKKKKVYPHCIFKFTQTYLQIFFFCACVQMLEGVCVCVWDSAPSLHTESKTCTSKLLQWIEAAMTNCSGEKKNYTAHAQHYPVK